MNIRALIDKLKGSAPAEPRLASTGGLPIFVIPSQELTLAEAATKLEALISANAVVHSRGKENDLLRRSITDFKKCFAVGDAVFVSVDMFDRPEIKSYISTCHQHNTIEAIYILQQLSMDGLVEQYLSRSGADVAQDQMGQSELEQSLTDIVADLNHIGASDLHVTVEGPTAELEYRFLGDLVGYKDWSGEKAMRLIRGIHFYASGTTPTFDAHINSEGRLSPDDFNLPPGVAGVRIEFVTLGFDGFMIVMRFAGTSSDAEATGYSEKHEEAFKRFREEREGIVIVSGPTGSGKSTKLRLEMRRILEEQEYKQRLVTVESPIEAKIKGARQMPVVYSEDPKQRKYAYANTMKSALRVDSDYLMLGECLEPSAAEMAFIAAITGHLLYTTIHTNDAIDIMFRFIDMEVPVEKVCQSGLVKGLVAQRLVQVLCDHCKLPVSENKELLPEDLYEAVEPLLAEGHELYTAKKGGCSHCRNFGASGRTAVAEVVEPNENFLVAVRAKDKAKAREIWVNELEGVTFLEHAISKMIAGEVDPRQVKGRVGRIDVDLDRLRAIGILEAAKDAA